MSHSLADHLLVMMSIKFAQRISASELADRLAVDRRVVVEELSVLARRGFTRCWITSAEPYIAWGLTGAGNAARNRLLSSSGESGERPG
jgi:DNA-binding transcriptional regulator LsrR (DeoR family)